MTFFQSQDLSSLRETPIVMDSAQTATVVHRLQQVHDLVYNAMRTLNYDLHQMQPRTVNPFSVTRVHKGGSLSLTYHRTRQQMAVVERLMGREEIASMDTVEMRRHPVIEMRLTPDYFVLELVLSPDAWWDQQNIAGKLTISRYRQELYTLLQTLPAQYRIGFWQGVHLSEMHLTAKQFQHPLIMDEWMSTFQPGSDWLRAGIWYGLGDSILEEETIKEEILRQMRYLYSLYEYVRWTSDNNFRDFYKPQKQD